MATKTVHFDDKEYRFSHGKTPRGRGSWAFATSSDPAPEDVWFSPGGMTLTEAKRWVRRDVLDLRFPEDCSPTTLYVLP